MALPTPAPVAEGVRLPQRPSKCEKWSNLWQYTDDFVTGSVLIGT